MPDNAIIPASHRDLLTEPRSISVLVTLMPDGQPQAQAVWVDLEGDNTIIVNTEIGRQKAKNMARNPLVTVLCLDPTNDDRYIEIRGVVESLTEADGVEVIERLSMKYAGQPFFGPPVAGQAPKSQNRITARIRPTRVVTRG
jgi:PPOX class probable F420-dependent enzyme